MSRNFELLTSLGLQTDIFEPEARAGIGATAKPTPAKEVPLPSDFVDASRIPEFERLVQRVFVAPAAKAPCVVTIVGINRASCQSLICSQIAAVLARAAKPICVVDADPDGAPIHCHFGTRNHVGLADALRSTDPIVNYVQSVPGSELHVLSVGQNIRDWHLIFNGEWMAHRATELRKLFRHVLFQAPPLGRYPHGTMFGQLSDGVIITLEALETRRDAAAKAKFDLDSAKVKVLGAVLNNRPFPIPKVLYSHL